MVKSSMIATAKRGEEEIGGEEDGEDEEGGEEEIDDEGEEKDEEDDDDEETESDKVEDEEEAGERRTLTSRSLLSLRSEGELGRNISLLTDTLTGDEEEEEDEGGEVGCSERA